MAESKGSGLHGESGQVYSRFERVVLRAFGRVVTFVSAFLAAVSYVNVAG